MSRRIVPEKSARVNGHWFRAHASNIRIPEQVSLICFNDEYFCDIVSPPLTTIGAPLGKMGEFAAQMLLKQIEKPQDYKSEYIKLKQNLITRASTAKPFS